MFLKAPWNLMHKLSLIVLMRKPRMKEEISGPESKAEGKWANKTVVGFPVGRLVIVRTSAKQRSGEGSFHEFIPNSAIILSRKHYFNPSKYGVFFNMSKRNNTLFWFTYAKYTMLGATEGLKWSLGNNSGLLFSPPVLLPLPHNCF